MSARKLTAADFADPERMQERMLKAERRAGVVLRSVMRRVFRDAAKRITDLTAVTASAVVDPDDLAVMLTEWQTAVTVELEPFFAAVYMRAAREAATAFGGTIAFDVTDPRVAQYLSAASNRLTEVGAAAWESARAALVEGITAGESILELQARVASVLHVTELRATTIARTEVGAAANGGSIEGIRALGDVAPQCKQWLATLGPRTRDTHAGADGQIVPLADSFDVGGDMLDYPGDPSGSPEEIISCRCTTLYVDCPSEIESGAEDIVDGDIESDNREFITAAQVSDSSSEPSGRIDPVPYLIVEDYEGCDDPAALFAVVAVDKSGEVLGCHPTRRDAVEQLAALYAVENPAEVDETVTAAANAVLARPPEWHAVAIIEESPSGDGRIWSAGSVTWRDVAGALPLMWQERQPSTPLNAHGESVRIGTVTAIERQGAEIHVWGVYLDDDRSRHVASQIADGHFRGVSFDGDGVTGQDVETIEDVSDDGETLSVTTRFHRTRLMGLTVVDFPAIPGAYIEPIESAESAESVEDVVTAAAEANTGVMVALRPTVEDQERLVVEGGLLADDIHCTLVFVADDAAALPSDEVQSVHDWASMWAAEHDPIAAELWATAHFNPGTNPAAVYLVGQSDGLVAAHDDALVEVASRVTDLAEQHDPWIPHVTAGYDVDPASLTGTGPVMFDRLRVAVGDDVTDYVLGSVAAEPEIEDLVTASIAIPDEPPAEWFDDPRLSGPTPLTVTDDGRVYGHIYRRGQCHTGYGNRCVTIDPDAVDYDGFHLGEIICADGSRVHCGQITVDAGHAPSFGRDGKPILAFAAKQHYEHTGWVGADLRAGPDRHGMWVAGAVRPGTTAAQLRVMMAAKPSGDWRIGDCRVDMDLGSARRNKRLALVAVAAVNVPGYPQTRAAWSGDECFALVASASFVDDDNVIRVPAGIVAAHKMASSIGRTKRQRADEWHAKIHGGA